MTGALHSLEEGYGNWRMGPIDDLTSFPIAKIREWLGA